MKQIIIDSPEKDFSNLNFGCNIFLCILGEIMFFLFINLFYLWRDTYIDSFIQEATSLFSIVWMH